MMKSTSDMACAWQQYQLPNVGPELNRIEVLILNVLANLSDAQIVHQFHDPHQPDPPAGWSILFPCSIRRYRSALRQYREIHGPPVPRRALALFELWKSLNPPENLSPRVTAAGDLEFPDFLVRQCLERETSRGNAWIIAAVPSSDTAIRCAAMTCCRRLFCTSHRLRYQPPPAPNDLVTVRIQGKGFDGNGGLTVPVTMEVQLPAAYRPWELLQRKQFQRSLETIVPAGNS